MAESGHREQADGRVAAGSAMLLLQLAASQAEIGPFARRGCETPQVATGFYRRTARLLSATGRRP